MTGNTVVTASEETIPRKINVADDDIAKTLLDADSETAKKLTKSITKLKPMTVRRRLRERKQPVRLFGETDDDTYLRLRRFELEALGSHRYADMHLRNDFRFSKDRQRKEEVEALLNREYNKAAGKLDDVEKSNIEIDREFKYDIKLPNIEPVVQEWLPQPGETEQEALDRGLQTLQKEAKKLKNGTRQWEMDLILHIFRYWQVLWGQELNNKRTFQQKMSVKGKSQTNIFKQTEDMMEPLYKQLRNHHLPVDIAEHLCEMLKCVYIERNYGEFFQNILFAFFSKIINFFFKKFR